MIEQRKHLARKIENKYAEWEQLSMQGEEVPYLDRIEWLMAGLQEHENETLLVFQEIMSLLSE